MVVDYSLNDQFWINALEDNQKSEVVINLFYNHRIDFETISQSMPLTVLTADQVCNIILRIIYKTPIGCIINIIRKENQMFAISKADICQFSDFEDCYSKCVSVLVMSNLKNVSWEKMGFLLRSKPRKKGADTKYGENHGKTACQLGLLIMNLKHEFNVSELGYEFNKLSDDYKEQLKSKLCLYIPIIHNYFCSNKSEDLLKSYFSILSESTQKRRYSNVRKLINIVNEDLNNEL